MSDISGTRRFRETEYNSRLQVTAVVSVITGVVLLAVSAFLLSYARLHEIAVAAGVTPALAGLYPLIFDTTLVVACVSALSLRGAPWWMRIYAGFSIVILLALVAVAEAVHAAGTGLPQRATAATLAAMPWALFLLGFGLVFAMLRHQRTVRAAALSAVQSNGKTPDVTLTRAEPEPTRPGPGPRTPEVKLTPGGEPDTRDVTPLPGPGHEHRHGHGHEHGHEHGHGAGDSGGD
jgi:hypothetical protein